MLSKKVVLFVTILFAGIVAFSLFAQWGGTGIGLFSFLFGTINLLMALIFALMKRYKASRSFLLMSGVFFLIGFGLCSAFPYNMH
jgi:hypothetical protein